MIKLVILITDQPFVEQPYFVEYLSSVASEWYGINPFRSRDSNSKVRIPHAPGVRETDSNGLRFGSGIGWPSDTDSTNIIGLAALNPFN
ncbi:MAG: hypothetical protein MRJ66_09560 [Nitrospira sp.]|nr:hypothetical protein [Nitrospira sp.]